jgi:hypothetical protein
MGKQAPNDRRKARLLVMAERGQIFNKAFGGMAKALGKSGEPEDLPAYLKATESAATAGRSLVDALDDLAVILREQIRG